MKMPLDALIPPQYRDQHELIRMSGLELLTALHGAFLREADLHASPIGGGDDVDQWRLLHVDIV